ncbi:MAG: hypothetical protein LUG84_02975, partial [Akkermansiaceae bacterium]|nr:hypothetical protein [Akkermansiaceae bacterium]
MKKSIIALALLSSAALAAEIPTTTDITNYTEATGHGTVSWTPSLSGDDPDSLSTWAFSFTVTVNSTTTGSKALISMTSASTGASGLSVVSSDGTYTKLAIGSAGAPQGSGTIEVTDGATYTLAYDASTYTA